MTVRRWGPLALVALIAALVYANAIGNGFVWDDAVIVPQGRTASLWHVLLSADEVGSYFRPLTRASLVVDWRIAGDDARWYHAVGLCLHACNAALLFALARKLSGKTGLALVAGLLFAVHPVCAEAVDFISARNNLLALFFSLSASLLFFAERDVLSALALFLGLLSKEPALMTVPVLALFAGRRRLLRLVPHAVAVVAYLALRFFAVGLPSPGASGGLLARLADDLWIVPHYLGLMLFPRDLTIFHEVPRRWPVAGLVVAWVALAAVSAWIVRRRAPAPLFGLAWFGLGLLPIANLVPIPSAAVAERYFYIPAAGLCLLAAAAFDQVRPRLGAALVAIAVVALGARTVARNRDWHDDVTLAASAVRVDPASVRARYNLGVALKDVGDLRGAMAQWQEGTRLDPSDAETLTQLGTGFAASGDFANAEAYWRRALASPAAPAAAHFNLARLLEKSGRPVESAREYEVFLRRSASGDPLAALARERLRALR